VFAAFEKPNTMQKSPLEANSTPGTSSSNFSRDVSRRAARSADERDACEDEVDVERPTPGEIVGQCTAEKQADRAATRAIAPKMPSALARSFER